MDTTEENRLINAILGGEVEAFAVLVHRYQRPIYNMMLRLTGHPEEAADLTQEAFLKVYENLERFRPNGRFFPWLYTIGLNLARDHQRRKKNVVEAGELPLDDGDLYQGPADHAAACLLRLDAERLPVLLAALPLEYREALVLRFHEGLTLRDVGLALGISTSGAKMRVQRGLQRLRDKLRLKRKSDGE
jgi:RNA polymerase sigma-70 factor (ECF subfamily)